MSDDTITLWRPVGPAELRLIEEANMEAFPPRLPEQPIFYPVTTEEYAVKIARDWNVPQSGSGFVTRFQVRRDYLDRYEVQDAGVRRTGSIGYPPRKWTPSTPQLSGRLRWCASFAERPLRVENGRSLADTTGLTAVHVNRTLKALGAEGLTTRTLRSVKINNWRRMIQVADFRSTYLHLPEAAL